MSTISYAASLKHYRLLKRCMFYTQHASFFQMGHSLVTVSVLRLEGWGREHYTKGTHTNENNLKICDSSCIHLAAVVLRIKYNIKLVLWLSLLSGKFYGLEIRQGIFSGLKIGPGIFWGLDFCPRSFFPVTWNLEYPWGDRHSHFDLRQGQVITNVHVQDPSTSLTTVVNIVL